MVLFNISTQSVGVLVTRFMMEYRELFRTLIFRDLLDRLIFLIAFGFGMGSIVRSIDGVSYLAFIAPGIACSSGMMTMTMAGSFGIYERMNSYKLWQSWLATPINLKEIMVAELIYASLRSTPPFLILISVVWALGALPSPLGVLIAFPIWFLGNFVFGITAMCFTSHIYRHLHFAYINTMWMMPMYLFSGVFFDLNHVPPLMHGLAQFFPLTHIINIVRPLMLGQDLPLIQLLLSGVVLIIFFLVAFWYAHKQLQKRLLS